MILTHSATSSTRRSRAVMRALITDPGAEMSITAICSGDGPKNDAALLATLKSMEQAGHVTTRWAEQPAPGSPTERVTQRLCRLTDAGIEFARAVLPSRAP